MSVVKFSIATQEESSLYGDILQEGFVDSYANLSIKSLMLAKRFTQVGSLERHGFCSSQITNFWVKSP